MEFWSNYRNDVNWNRKRLDQKADEFIQGEPSTPTHESYTKTCWCKASGAGMKGEVMNGDNEPLEVLYTCSRCDKQVLSVEGLRDEIVREGSEDGK